MKNSKPRGLGDKIEQFTEKTGIKKVVKTIFGDDCGCDERRNKLNAMFPNFKNIRPFTKDEKEIYEQVMPEIDKINRINKQQKFVLNRIYKAVFSVDGKFNSCGSCTEKTLNNLRKVYEKSCKI